MDNQTQPNVPPFQSPTQTPITSSTNWSKILFFIIFGLIVITGSVFAGIQIGKNQITKQQLIIEQPTIFPTQVIINPTVMPTTTSSTTEPTADWKTYKGEIFEYKYPSNLYLSESSLTDNRSFYKDKTSADESENCQKNQLGTIQNPCESPLINIFITIYNLDQSDKAGGFIQPVEFTTSGGIKLIKEGSLVQGMGKSLNLRAHIINKSTLYNVDIQTSPQDYGDWQLLNQILSTFKFTN